jgi:hypothetical protein
MARSKSSTSSGVNIPDLMEVICDYRKEAFPFEKYVALMTFSTWLHAPIEPEIVLQSRIIAAALVMLSMNNGRLPILTSERKATIDAIVKNAFQPLDAAEALVDRCISGTFWEGIEGQRALYDASAVAAFIIRCPPAGVGDAKKRPSVNKALFFIDEGGFTGDAFNEEEDRNEPYTVAPATVKKGWGSSAVASPFWLAADRLKVYSIAHLAPDDEGSILKASDLLGDTTRIRQYFGSARYIQEALLKRLDKASRKRFHFVQFPKSIALHPVEPRPFNAAQLEIIKGYKAKFLAGGI